MKRKSAKLRQLTLAVTAMSFAAGSVRAADALTDLRNLSIEDLGEIEVTSVTKRAEPVSEAPAAIYVITNDDIRRYGATSLGATLRLAPNLEVAQLDALSYVISARGFNSTEASNKLLVLIDGRSVYSPLHSGIFWDAQDLMLDDVDRIEVIDGPGGTLWGANAVNGVINVISKSPFKTLGGLGTASAGNVDNAFSGRYGFLLGENLATRVYLKATNHGHSKNLNGTNHVDDWDGIQGGFASEWNGDSDVLRIQADSYSSALDIVSSDVSGTNVVGKWSHTFSGDSALDVQVYYDRTHRRQPPGILETVKTYDIDLQHAFAFGDRHAIVWGGGYRVIHDFFVNTPPLVLVHPRYTLKLGNGFIQDTIALSPTVNLIAGIKVEHHTYTGFEYMPSARLAWQPQDGTLLWAAISRAVRTPSRIDRELQALPILSPSPNFQSEDLLAYEVGYRGRVLDRLTVSISGYYNDYSDLRTTQLSPSGGFPVMLGNGMEGHTYGVDAWAQYGVTTWWRLFGGVSAIEKSLHLKPGVVDISNFQAAGNDPSYQFQFRSQMSPLENVDFDVTLRTVDDLTSPTVSGYTTMDARFAWRLRPWAEIAVTGFNLFDAQRLQAGSVGIQRAVRRSVSGSLRVSF